MAVPNTNPIFPGGYGRAHAEVDTAETTFDGSGGNIVEVLDVAALGHDNGIMIRKITVKARETTTAQSILFYLSPDAGTTWHPWRTILVDAATPAAGVAAFEAQLDDQNDAELAGGLMLPSGWSLGASIYAAEDTSIHVEYGIF